MSRKRSSETEVIALDHLPMQLELSSADRSLNNDSSSRPKIRVRIKKWHGVAHWSWNCGEDDDVCGICQGAYEGVAPNCKYPGDECPVVWVSHFILTHSLCINI